MKFHHGNRVKCHKCILGFRVEGDFLVPTNIELPFAVPRVHAAKNIGSSTYHEILFETKKHAAAADRDL